MKIVYFGTAEFAVPALDALLKAGHNVPFVVTQPDRPRGRGNKMQPTPVGLYAEEKGLKLLKPERLSGDEEFMAELTEARPDLIVVTAYGKVLPKQLLLLPPLGCVNIHASLLPEYRGAAPVQRAILDGKDETGVTLMYMAEGLDTGDIIACAKVQIGGMNAGELTDALARVGAELLVGTIPTIEAGAAPRLPQEDSKATYAEKVEKAEGHIDLSGSAEEAVRLVRAMTPAPGAYVLQGADRIVITKARAASPENGGINIRMGEGVLVVEELKVPGKKAMAVAEYLKGNVFDTEVPLS